MEPRPYSAFIQHLIISQLIQSCAWPRGHKTWLACQNLRRIRT